MASIYDSKPLAAGLAVKAKDTGRVLVMQRSYAAGDPAAGKFEFPGGMLERHESALEGARREFGEEIGVVPPRSAVVNTWRSGVYQGYVIEIPTEKSLKINQPFDSRKRFNPDNPEGDEVETALWVEPQSLKKNPMLRDELKAAMHLVQKALSTKWSDQARNADRLRAVRYKQGKLAGVA